MSDDLDIDNLQAGEEADALIATEVMGWTRGSISVREPSDSALAVWKSGQGEEYTVHNYISAWRPSIEPIDTLEVIRQLDESYSAWFKIRGPSGWLVHCNIPVYGAFSGIASTFSLAVCRAALKAVVGIATKKRIEES